MQDVGEGVGVRVFFLGDHPFSEDWALAHLALEVGVAGLPHFVFVGIFVGHSHLLTRRAWLELFLCHLILTFAAA